MVINKKIKRVIILIFSGVNGHFEFRMFLVSSARVHFTSKFEVNQKEKFVALIFKKLKLDPIKTEKFESSSKMSENQEAERLKFAQQHSNKFLLLLME